jgi:hypothetical protein
MQDLVAQVFTGESSEGSDIQQEQEIAQVRAQKVFQACSYPVEFGYEIFSQCLSRDSE